MHVNNVDDMEIILHDSFGLGRNLVHDTIYTTGESEGFGLDNASSTLNSVHWYSSIEADLGYMK